MNPLDNKSILALRKVLEAAKKNAPYALLFNDHVVVTNHGWLMEWPIDLVDLECPRFNKLLDNQKMDVYQGAKTRLQEEGWRNVLFDDAGKFAKVVEVEPVDDDIDCDQIIYLYRRKERLQYCHSQFTATELFVEDPEYRLYRPAKDEGMPDQFKPLVIFEPGTPMPVGIFMNDYPRPYFTRIKEDQDDE